MITNTAKCFIKRWQLRNFARVFNNGVIGLCRKATQYGNNPLVGARAAAIYVCKKYSLFCERIEVGSNSFFPAKGFNYTGCVTF